MDPLDLLIDLHTPNDRQAPGDDAETRRALALTRLPPTTITRIADLGCGAGASALLLARDTAANVTAVDAAPAFIDRLRDRAARAGLSHRIDPHVGDMRSPPCADGELDLLWSEGAVYNIGFADGLRGWRRLLRPGGVVAVTELSWLIDDRPAEVEAHWASEYPGMRSVSTNLRTLEAAGYLPLGCFALPRTSWTESYYAPLRAGFARFLDRHDHANAAKEIVAAEEREIRLFETFGHTYGYVFYIARRAEGAEPVSD